MKSKRFREKRLSAKQLKLAARALSPQAYATLIKIDTLEDERGFVRMSNAALAKYCNIGESTLKEHLAEIRSTKLLVESERKRFRTAAGTRECLRVRVIRPVEYCDFKALCRRKAKSFHYWLANRTAIKTGVYSFYAVLQNVVKCLVGEAIIEPVFEDFALTKLKMRMCDDPNLARR